MFGEGSSEGPQIEDAEKLSEPSDFPHIQGDYIVSFFLSNFSPIQTLISFTSHKIRSFEISAWNANPVHSSSARR